MSDFENEYKALGLDLPVLEAWKRRYEDLIGTAPSDDDELERIRDLRAKVRAGLVWNEQGEESHIGASEEWTPESVRAAVGDGLPGAEDNRRRLLLTFGGLALFFCLCSTLVLAPGMLSQPAAPKKTRTPTPNLTAQAGDAPFQATVIPVAINSANLKLALEAPRSLDIRGQGYEVQPGAVDDKGNIILTNINPDKPVAVWFASPANWLIGLPEARVTALTEGDKITARTTTGRVLTFVVDGLQDAKPQEIERLAQRRVGLTIMPLPASGVPVRLVSATYDATGEQMDAAAVRPGIGAPAPIPGGQFVITAVTVNAQRAGLYQVLVRGETTLALAAPFLSVNGQRYTPTGAGVAAGPFTAEFVTMGIGPSEFGAGETRVDLGELKAPHLAADVLGADVVTGKTLRLTIQVGVAGGSAYVLPSQLGLRSAQYGGETESPPLALEPLDAQVQPGEPVVITATFGLLPNTRSGTVRLFEELWNVTWP